MKFIGKSIHTVMQFLFNEDTYSCVYEADVANQMVAIKARRVEESRLLHWR